MLVLVSRHQGLSIQSKCRQVIFRAKVGNRQPSFHLGCPIANSLESGSKKTKTKTNKQTNKKKQKKNKTNAYSVLSK